MNNEYSLLTIENKAIVSGYFNSVIDILNNTGLYNFMKQDNLYQLGKNELSKLVANGAERKLNKSFHENLNLIEKMGFVSNAKYIEHQKKVGITKGLLTFFVEGGMDLAPAIIDYYYRQRRVKNIKEYVIGWLAYINKENDIRIQMRVQELYRKIGEKFDFTEYDNIFKAYSENNINRFPILHDNNINEKYKLSRFILSVIDLNDEDKVNRAKEFCSDYLKLVFTNTEQELLYIKENQEYISDLSTFTGFSIMDIFKNICDDIESAKQASFYSLENDPFKVERDSRKNKLIEIIKIGVPDMLGALTFHTGPVGDALLTASSPAIIRLINPEIDIKKTIEIQKTMKELKSRYNDDKQ